MSIDRDMVRRVVRAVIREMAGSTSKKRPDSAGRSGPRVLAIFHGGLGKVDEALGQVRRIESRCLRFSVFTVTSIRGRLCGRDVQEQTGAECVLDTVKPAGLDKVLDRSDLLLAPTFCLITATKVARLTADDLGSNIVLRALMQNKPVLASNDSFQILDRLVNRAIMADVDQMLGKLEQYGMALCATRDLEAHFEKMIGRKDEPPRAHETTAELKWVTAEDVRNAVKEKKTRIELAPGGGITPLAQDLARELSIEIVGRPMNGRT